MQLWVRQMAVSHINSYSKHQSKLAVRSGDKSSSGVAVLGMTLIEVLIALAIIAIAMTAVIKASSQTIRSTSYLQEKTIAMWVGQQALNEVRVGVLKLSGTEPLTQKTEMLDQDWYTEVKQEETPNNRIMKIEVRVFAHEPEGEEDIPVIDMETYIYRE